MKKINESFVCLNCGKKIEKAKKTYRNHCPYCFTSCHMDGEIPGDRKTNCHGEMYPIAYEIKKSEIRILFYCIKCGKKHRNKRATDDDIINLPKYIEEYHKKIVK